MKYVFKITPVPKPRMTQRDKWLDPPRPGVGRYWAFKDELNLKARVKKLELPRVFDVDFYVLMPKSWSEKKKKLFDGQYHMQTPDRDNLLKALQDALCVEDGYICDGRVGKRWSRHGRIEISF